jgi:hypothetical protein
LDFCATWSSALSTIIVTTATTTANENSTAATVAWRPAPSIAVLGLKLDGMHSPQ